METSLFRLEIVGLATFAAFCELIRGLNDEQLREMTARLTHSTAALADAEQHDADHHNP